jgi:hypothetical protein
MRSRQKVTRVQLELSTEEDYKLLGIVSSEPDYRLSLSLNKKLKISLRNNKPITIKSEDGAKLNFSKFSDIKEAPDIIYNLISNRSEKDFLLRKLRKIDYLFQIHNLHFRNNDDITLLLRQIDSITAVFVLDPADIKYGKSILQFIRTGVFKKQKNPLMDICWFFLPDWCMDLN